MSEGMPLHYERDKQGGNCRENTQDGQVEGGEGVEGTSSGLPLCVLLPTQPIFASWGHDDRKTKHTDKVAVRDEF